MASNPQISVLGCYADYKKVLIPLCFQVLFSTVVSSLAKLCLLLIGRPDFFTLDPYALISFPVLVGFHRLWKMTFYGTNPELSLQPDAYDMQSGGR